MDDLDTYLNTMDRQVFNVRLIGPGQGNGSDRAKLAFLPRNTYKVLIQQSAKEVNIYNSVNPIDPNKGRGIAGVTHLQFIILDVDFTGDESNSSFGVESLRAYIGLNPTMIIKTGNGMHFYYQVPKYPLNTRDEKKEIAAKIRTWVNALPEFPGIKIDKQCTVDLGRILRPPSTFNLKDINNPKPVTLTYFSGKVHSILLEQILALEPTYGVSDDGEIDTNYQFIEVYMSNMERFIVTAKASAYSWDFNSIITGVPVDTLGYKSRSEAVFAVAIALARVGCSPDQIWTFLRKTNIRSQARAVSWMDDPSMWQGNPKIEITRTIFRAIMAAKTDEKSDR